ADLVFTAHQAQILRKLKGSRIVITWSGARSGEIEAALNAEAEEFRLRDPHIDTQVAGIEILRARFVDLRSIHRRAEVADRSGPEQIGISQNKRIHSKRQSRVDQRKQVFGIKVGWLIQARLQIAAEQAVFIADLIVDPA